MKKPYEKPTLTVLEKVPFSMAADSDLRGLVTRTSIVFDFWDRLRLLFGSALYLVHETPYRVTADRRLDSGKTEMTLVVVRPKWWPRWSIRKRFDDMNTSGEVASPRPDAKGKW